MPFAEFASLPPAETSAVGFAAINSRNPMLVTPITPFELLSHLAEIFAGTLEFSIGYAQPLISHIPIV